MSIKLEPFEKQDWKLLNDWIENKTELIQFAGEIFTFPIDEIQLESYLNDNNREVFMVKCEENKSIGIAEIYNINSKTAKLARILIGDKSMRGK